VGFGVKTAPSTKSDNTLLSFFFLDTGKVPYYTSIYMAFSGTGTVKCRENFTIRFVGGREKLAPTTCAGYCRFLVGQS